MVVTINYRLGALGFLDVPGESPTGAAGLHDQIAALRWTRENIAAFGGDPDQITVYGLSAGGKSVTNLLGSPLTSGLIARAAESSGGDHVKDPAQAEALTGRLLRELGTTARQLRSVPAVDILNAQLNVAAMPRSTWIWRPSVDGVALTGNPVTAIAAGSAAGVPLLLQTCARECALYALLGPDGPAQADRVLAGYFGQATAAQLLAAYADAFPDLGADALRTIVMTDERYVVRTEQLADRAGQACAGLAVPLRRPLHRPRGRPGSGLRAVRAAADRGARRRRRRHLAGRFRSVRRPARQLGRARHHRRPRLGTVRVGRAADDDLRAGRPARRGRPVR